MEEIVRASDYYYRIKPDYKTRIKEDDDGNYVVDDNGNYVMEKYIDSYYFEGDNGEKKHHFTTIQEGRACLDDWAYYRNKTYKYAKYVLKCEAAEVDVGIFYAMVKSMKESVEFTMEDLKKACEVLDNIIEEAIVQVANNFRELREDLFYVDNKHIYDLLDLLDQINEKLEYAGNYYASKHETYFEKYYSSSNQLGITIENFRDAV